MSEENTIKVINKININKSSAIKDVSAKVLKDAFECLPFHLTYMFNLSINTSIFPDAWKEATIIPLPKEGDMTDVGNYRPVSLLPLPSKLFEKLIHGQVIEYLDNKGILDSQQGGFRKNCSTTKTTSEFLDDIYYAINNKKYTKAIFMGKIICACIICL